VLVENLGPFSSSTLDFLRDAESLIFQVMTERFCSSFKESRSRFNVLTPCYLHDSFSIDRPDH